jgi:hypothetical protein
MNADAALTAVAPSFLTAVLPAFQASFAQQEMHDVEQDFTFASGLQTLEVKSDLSHMSVPPQSASDLQLSLIATHL